MDRLFTAVEPHLLVGLAVAIVLSLAISMTPVFQRRGPLCAISVIGAAVYFWQQFAGFLIVCGFAYLALRWINGQTLRAPRWHRAVAALILLVTGFTIGRLWHSDALTVTFGPSTMVLYSLDMWMALRLVTLFWEVGSGAVALPSPGVYLTWICSPFTLGGPLLRYSKFPGSISINRTFWTSPAWWRDLGAAAAKFTLGLLLPVAQHAVFGARTETSLLSKALSALVTGPGGFYLSTAGYFHLMELLGAPCGFKLPTSFNYPFGRENIAAFWTNWNMTATGVFRDYIFYNRWGFQTYHMYANTIVLFTLVGLWHAANAYWILWGFLHGLLFCVYLAWRKHGNRLGALPLRGTPISRTAARVLTYICVCMCWYLPSKILQKLGSV